jgi:hypothetical protein
MVVQVLSEIKATAAVAAVAAALHQVHREMLVQPMPVAMLLFLAPGLAGEVPVEILLRGQSHQEVIVDPQVNLEIMEIQEVREVLGKLISLFKGILALLIRDKQEIMVKQDNLLLLWE